MKKFGMNLTKWTRWTLLSGLALVAAACSSGGGGGGTSAGTILNSLQDLTLDPAGTTTILTFSQPPGAVGTSFFTADGGQTALSALGSGSSVTVTWDLRVSPAHTISISGLPGIQNGTSTPTTSDASAPTFTITNSAQNAGIGADTLEVTFAGPRVDELDAEDPTSWTLTANSTAMDLTGSVFVLDPLTQIMTMTLGGSANLHSTFTLAASSLVSVADTALAGTPVNGTASGDATAPTLTSVIQNLTQDEFGRVIDFTFNEAMSPAFSESVGNFSASGTIPATSVSQPTAGVLRVTFNAPVIPGVNTITPSNMMDVHGNTLTLGAQAVTQPSPVTNSFSSNNAVTVANIGGDHVAAVFAQAFDATSATTLSNWALVVNAVTIDLNTQTVSYDFLNKTLRIDLDFDMLNGEAFSLTATSILEVDGESFSAASAGTVSGDVVAPTVVGVLQNRVQDPSGSTLDVTFSEDLAASAVSVTGNWAVSGLTVSSVLLLGTPNIARVSLTGGAAVPGIATLDVSGLSDVAGNAIVAVVGHIVTSTDTTPPGLVSTDGAALEGADNDTVTVRFDDDMVQADVETPGNWAIESPVGSSMTTAGGSIAYTSATRTAVFTFDAANAQFFKLGDGLRVTISNARDIGSNAITATPLDGTIVFESNHPSADFAFRDGTVNTEVVVRFSEHMNFLDDLYDATTNVAGVRYLIRDNGGAVRGFPNMVTILGSGLGARLGFGFVINATDTMDVSGATDLVGNYMYPALALPLATEDTNPPALGTQVTPLLAVSGERNDVITMVFDRNISPWGAENYQNFTVNDGSSDIDLSSASFAFDGADTVSITLDSGTAASLQAVGIYSFSVNGLQSEFGVAMSAPSTLGGNTVSGDIATPPVIGPTSVRMDRLAFTDLLIFSDEALDRSASEDVSLWLYAGSTFPDTASLIDPTTVRLSFPVNMVAGNNFAFNPMDLAGNTQSGIQTIQSSEAVPPALLSVQGTAVSGEGGDFVTVSFDEPVDASTGLAISNYVLTNGGNAMTLTNSGARYDSTNFAMILFLAPGFEFDSALGIGVTVTNVADYSGNTITVPAVLAGIVVGDTSTAPGVLSAFSNYRENASGLLVDVLFDEAPEQTFITNPFSWSVTGAGGQTVLGVTRIDEDQYRVALSGALGAGEELEILAGMPDLAGNQTLSVTSVTVTE